MSTATESEKRKELGDYLKSLLLHYSLKQSDLAKHLGVTRQYVGLITGGKTALSSDHFKQIRSWFFKHKLQSHEIDRFMQLYIESRINLKRDLPPTSEDIYQVVLELKKYVNQELVLNRCLELATMEADQAQTMRQILSTLGEAVSSEHCCIYVYEERLSAAQLIFEWHRDGTSEYWNQLHRLPLRETPWRKKLLHDEVINLGRDNTFMNYIPESCVKFYHKHPFKSLLICGIWHHGKLFGTLVLGNHTNPYKFVEQDERLCQSVCRIIQLLLERR